MGNAASGENASEYIRLPKPGERCPVTGLSRTSLVELIEERDPESGEFVVLQYTKARHGKQRGIRMIHRASLLAELDKRSRGQSLRQLKPEFNPQGYTVDQVVSTYSLWQLFVDPDREATRRDWEKLPRSSRIKVLEDLGFLVPVRPAPES